MGGKSVYRFGVKNNEGKHSKIWRAWSDGNEVYLAHRWNNNTYKISLHGDGTCHAGITRETRETLIGDESWDGVSRHFLEWNIGPELGVNQPQVALEILFPNSHLEFFN